MNQPADSAAAGQRGDLCACGHPPGFHSSIGCWGSVGADVTAHVGCPCELTPAQARTAGPGGEGGE